MLILDFDGSVQPLDGATIVPLREREESIRFGCRMSELRSLRDLIPPSPIVFMGSGDFHHVSFLLIERVQTQVEVVVFDNHPDNMRYPFGIHCGSWVSHVSRLPHVSRVHILGITSSDVEGLHAIENRLRPLRSGKVVYWCVQRDLRVLRAFGARDSRSFSTVREMLATLGGDTSIYLSIDKDVLAPGEVQTNWDQGVMRLDELELAIAMLRGRIVASDIVGDVSSYRYRSRFKRLLSGLDRQPPIPPESLAAWQAGHREVNLRLLNAIRSG